MEHVKSAVPMMSTIISKKRGKVMEEMEKLLSVWMQDQRRVPLSLTLIQEKAKSLYEDLKKKHSEESEGASFNASHSNACVMVSPCGFNFSDSCDDEQHSVCLLGIWVCSFVKNLFIYFIYLFIVL